MPTTNLESLDASKFSDWLDGAMETFNELKEQVSITVWDYSEQYARKNLPAGRPDADVVTAAGELFDRFMDKLEASLK